MSSIEGLELAFKQLDKCMQQEWFDGQGRVTPDRRTVASKNLASCVLQANVEMTAAGKREAAWEWGELHTGTDRQAAELLKLGDVRFYAGTDDAERIKAEIAEQVHFFLGRVFPPLKEQWAALRQAVAKIGRSVALSRAKGEPGRRYKYDPRLADFAFVLQAEEPRPEAKEVLIRCRQAFPGAVLPETPELLRAFLRREAKKRT
jgi:hypothetical protein